MTPEEKVEEIAATLMLELAPVVLCLRDLRKNLVIKEKKQ